MNQTKRPLDRAVTLLLPIAFIGSMFLNGWAFLLDGHRHEWFRLGFVFGVTVLLSGDAALFMSYSVIGTVITVIVKGTVAGACAGWIYRLFESKNKWIAAITASAIAPVVNTGIFFIGSAVFFFNDLTAFASTVGYDSFVSVMFGYMIGFNFIAEFAFNLIVTPVIYRVIDLGVGMADKKATERH